MSKTFDHKFFVARTFTQGLRTLLVIAVGLSVAQVGAVPAIAASKPSACSKVSTEVINADKVYIAAQYGVVQAAKSYLANGNLTNRLLYNDSYVKAIQTAITELTFAINSPTCYSASAIASYKANVKSNKAAILTIQADNVNGTLVSDPKVMAKYTPVGLLK